MPDAIPAGAAALLPPARMIDPRGHRFGAGVSAILLIVATVIQAPFLVLVALVSIATSAAFGLKYSIYGAIWRRIVKVAGLPQSMWDITHLKCQRADLGDLIAFALQVSGNDIVFELYPKLLAVRADKNGIQATKNV